MAWTVSDLRLQFKRAKAVGWLETFTKCSHKYSIPLEILLGVGSRETNIRNILGDDGHGHGIMQVDDRSYPLWCKSGEWMDPHKSIDMGAYVLSLKIAKASKTGNAALRVGIASYNVGSKAIEDYLRFKNPDRRTTGHDYSADVLRRAKVFRGIISHDGVGEMGKAVQQVSNHVLPVSQYSMPIGNSTVSFADTVFRGPPEGWLDAVDSLDENIKGTNMTKEMIADFIRFFMKVIGTWVLATKAAAAGGITVDDWQTITSAALVLGSFGWSLASTHGLTKEN